VVVDAAATLPGSIAGPGGCDSAIEGQDVLPRGRAGSFSHADAPARGWGLAGESDVAAARHQDAVASPLRCRTGGAVRGPGLAHSPQVDRDRLSDLHGAALEVLHDGVPTGGGADLDINPWAVSGQLAEGH